MRPITNYLPDVKNQYEALPYPARDPADESSRLLRTWLDDLTMLNHYCFAGRQTFGNGFRALLAGGGTGDGTVFLEEQLKHTDAQIVHLDMSGASIAIARERARTGLTLTVNPGRYGPQILRLINGQRSFGEIFDQFRRDWTGKAAAPDNATLFADFAESYETLNAIERLLLRHPPAGLASPVLAG